MPRQPQSTDQSPARRPRLLVVASTYPARPGDGTPAFVRDLAIESATVFDTMVLTPAVPGAPGVEQDGPLTVRRFRYFPRRWETIAHGALLENARSGLLGLIQVPALLIGEAIAMWRAVRRFRPDVIHVHWLIPQGAVALLAGRGVPWLVTSLGGDLYSLRDPISLRVKRAVVRRAAVLTTMSEDMRGRMLDLGGDPARTHVIPMGADSVTVQAAAAGVDPVPGRVAVAGRLVEKKGIGPLIAALRLVPATVQWSLVVVGDGPLLTDLRAMAEGLPVEFRGQLSKQEMAVEMARASVIAFPSARSASGDQDGLPVALLEAMSVGRPVVVSDLPGLADVVTDGESGRVVASADPQALAEAIESVLTLPPDEWDRMASAAAQAAEPYSMGTLGARYRDLLVAVAARS